jgi:23S rRNA pseudouridine2605 synthase
MSKQAFEKFINKSKSGAKKKEAIRQEKKRIKAELKAQGEELRKRNEERYRMVTSTPKTTAAGPFKPASDKNKKREKPAAGTGSFSAQYNQSAANSQPSGGRKVQPAAAKTAPAGSRKESNSSNTAEQMPLNKFIAHAGICGRREAAELVKEGKVTVNGDRIFEPGYKVSARDKVEVKGKQLFLQKNLVYILVNKPKDYITTAKDPQGRKTILDLVKGATQERIYPVGRLDRNTTGVLVMTNDGELAQKLTHPSFEIKKVYEVTLDQPLVKKDFEAIVKGITLEDGFVAADALGYVDAKDKSVIGIEIHSGRNRIVRRIFEHLGYKVKNLDRVMFANLTKKNVDRGKWRFLTEKEVRLLKFMNQSFVRKKAGV